MKYFCTIL